MVWEWGYAQKLLWELLEFESLSPRAKKLVSLNWK